MPAKPKPSASAYDEDDIDSTQRKTTAGKKKPTVPMKSEISKKPTLQGKRPKSAVLSRPKTSTEDSEKKKTKPSNRNEAVSKSKKKKTEESDDESEEEDEEEEVSQKTKSKKKNVSAGDEGTEKKKKKKRKSHKETSDSMQEFIEDAVTSIEGNIGTDEQTTLTNLMKQLFGEVCRASSITVKCLGKGTVKEKHLVYAIEARLGEYARDIAKRVVQDAEKSREINKSQTADWHALKLRLNIKKIPTDISFAHDVKQTLMLFFQRYISDIVRKSQKVTGHDVVAKGRIRVTIATYYPTLKPFLF
jgi:hypothetical protein